MTTLDELLIFLTIEDLKRYTIKRGRNLLDKYGGEDWKMKIDHRTKSWRIGQCRGNGVREIGISEWWLKRLITEAIDELRSAVVSMKWDIDNVLCHEIAHIGPKGHTLDWKRQYASLLFTHFGDRWSTEQCLRKDQYCKDEVQRLIDETKDTPFKPFKPKPAKAAAVAIKAADVSSLKID
jgi:hypothetical protein